MTTVLKVALPIVLIGCTGEVTIDDPGISEIEHDLGISIPGNVQFLDPSGYIGTFSTHGSIDLGNEFFQDLGTNGRRCITCHLPSTGWTISPPQVRAVFDATLGGELDDLLGLGAIFRT